MKNLSVIEALRGFAALIVMLFHFSAGKYGAPEWWSKICINGQLGVHIFFVISGFVIPLQLSRKDYQLVDYWRLQGNRFLRIYPCFLVVTVLGATMWFVQYKFLGGSTPPDLSASNILKNLTLTASALEGTFFVNVSWTLAIEFFYYLFLGLFFGCLFSQKMPLRVCSNVVFLSLGFVIPGGSMWNFFHWVPFFGVGFYLYRIKAKKHFMESVIFLITSLILILFKGGFLPGIHQLVAVVLTAGLILWAPALKGRAILGFGTISYSLYLVHNIFGTQVFRVFEVLKLDDFVPYFVILFAAMAVSILLSFLSFRFVETPSHLLSKKVWRKKRERLMDSAPFT